MEDRLPLREKISSPKNSKSSAGTQETAASIAYDKRKMDFTIARDEFFLKRAQESKISSLANIAHGKKIRQRFDKS
jgi:hypothetical protein